MTESDVDTLLVRSSRRLRLAWGCRVALAGLGVGLLAGAGVVLLARLRGSEALLTAGMFLPPLFALAGLIVAFFRYRPALSRVALLLDRRSNSAEHLVTWHEFRTQPQRIQNSVQREMLDLQRASTLQRAAGIDPRKLIPLEWPDWSRVVLLAFLLLCCAWLTPRYDGSSERVAADDARSRHGGAHGRAMAASATADAQEDELPTMELLSQAEQQKFMLISSDERLSDAQKSEQLKDLQSKLAGIPESQLTKLDREVMKLRADAGTSDKPKDPGNSDASSAQKTSLSNEHESESSGPIHAARVSDDPTNIFNAIRTQFPADLQHRLDRYYHAGRAPGGTP